MHRLAVRLAFLFLFALGLVAAPLAARAAGPSDGLGTDPSLDRGSPRRSFEGFLRAGGGGDSVRAAHYLDLRGLPAGEQATKGAELAQELWYLTTHVGRFDLFKIPDDADAPIPKGEPSLVVGTLDDRDGPVPLAMQRVKFPDGVDRWIFARTTIAMVPALYATVARPQWSSRLPAWMNDPFLGNAVWQWLALLALIPLSYLAARALAAVLLRIGAVVARRRRSGLGHAGVARMRRPLRLAIGAVVVRAASEPLLMTQLVDHVIGHVTLTMLIVAGAWGLLRGVEVLARWLEDRIEPGEGVDVEALRRAARTRAALFGRFAALAVTVLAFALALLQFEVVRAVGVSLLASAGVAGVVLGFAAQRSLGAIVGGMQLAMTQPIRIGDSVWLDGELAIVDQIYLTHVIVRRWDDRRVVYPVARFLEQPFQNLSKFGSQQTAAIELSCDAARSVDELRSALHRVCRASSLWDQRVCALEVTGASPTTLTLRALVSARDPLSSHRLACDVREQLAPMLRPPAEDAARARTSSAPRLTAPPLARPEPRR